MTEPPGDPPGDGGTDPQAVARGITEFEPLSSEEAGTVEPIAELHPAPKTEPYNAQKHLDETRSQVAFRLIWILVGVLLFGFALLLIAIDAGADKIANIGPTYLAVFSSIITLVSAATGFYFGQSGGSGKDGS